MISISSQQKLSLLSPETNRALAKIIKEASPQQLKQLTQNSDLKSLLSSMFDKSIGDTKSDKVLLDILKNSNSFKEMGSFSKDLTILQELVKSNDLPHKIEEAISRFIKNIDSIDSKLLKTQISNSGIFLESKLAQAVEPKAPLKEILQELQQLLQKSTKQEIKVIQPKIEQLLQELNTDKKTDTPKSIELLSNNIQKLKNSLQSLHVKGDILYSKAVDKLINSLHVSIKSNLTQNRPIDIKSAVVQTQELYSLTLQSKSPVSTSILDTLEKILTVLKSVEKTPDMPLKDTKILQLLDKVSDTLHVNSKNSDVIYSKQTSKLIDKLELFSKPEGFSQNRVINERIIDDMKANILHLNHEIKKSSSLKNSDIPKIVDKLTLQIDYYQLYSHLNNSSSIYFPFVWDKIEDGSVSIKKVKKNRFYCEINLNLKDYGELKVMLALYDKNQINLNIFIEHKELKNSLRENIASLRKAFIEADLTLRDVRFIDKEINKADTYAEDDSNLDMGFEVMV